MRNGPVRINQTYSTFPMSLPSVVRSKRVRLFRLQLFPDQVGRQTHTARQPAAESVYILKKHRATRCGEHKRTHTHTHTHDDKKRPNTIDIIDKRVVVLVEIIAVIAEGGNYYCSKHENRYT